MSSFAGERVAELDVALFEGAAAAVFAEDERVVGHADGFGGHDLVGERVDHDAVLVDAGGVGEGVGSDDGLVGRGAEGDALGQHLAGGVELVHDDVVLVGQLVAAGGEDGGEFFEGGVAGALADAVDGALDLADAGLDGGDGSWRRPGRGRRGSARRG